MKSPVRQLVTFITLVVVTAAASLSQQNQDTSSNRTAACKFPDGKNIQTTYSSPRVNGRKIFGGIVPNGGVWPVGGSPAATFTSDSDLTIGGEDVPAGNYLLFAIPAADKWTLIISKKKSGSNSHYSKDDDLLRADMRISKMPQLVEDFTIAYESK